jgi:hypothetical protein
LFYRASYRKTASHFSGRTLARTKKLGPKPGAGTTRLRALCCVTHISRNAGKLNEVLENQAYIQ